MRATLPIMHRTRTAMFTECARPAGHPTDPLHLRPCDDNGTPIPDTTALCGAHVGPTTTGVTYQRAHEIRVVLDLARPGSGSALCPACARAAMRGGR